MSRRLLPAVFGIAACLVSSPLEAQHLGSGEGVEVSIWRIIAALLVSAMAILALALVLRSRGGSLQARMPWLSNLARNSRIVCVETRRVTSQAELSVVRCDQIEYVILSAQGHAQVLERRDLTLSDGEQDKA